MKQFTIIGAVSLSIILGVVLVDRLIATEGPLAKVNGQEITSDEIEKLLGGQLSKLEEQIYDLKRQKLEEVINGALLTQEAAKRKISVPALLDAEITTKVSLVTEQEVEKFYQDNKGRLQGEEATLRQQIRQHLQNQKLTGRRQEFLQALRSQAKVVVNLKPPPVFRAQVSVDGAPFKGPAKAPVTIVKFEDFHCPFCKRVQDTLGQLLIKYGKQIKVVHRDFPIDALHPNARRGHEAARCANDQGKFWQYHDLLYANAPNASAKDLAAYADQAGLNVPVFEKCLLSGNHRQAVQMDIDEGTRQGITGTPTFFVNGRVVTGAQSLETFASMVDEELARAR